MYSDIRSARFAKVQNGPPPGCRTRALLLRQSRGLTVFFVHGIMPPFQKGTANAVVRSLFSRPTGFRARASKREQQSGYEFLLRAYMYTRTDGRDVRVYCPFTQ